MYAEERQQAIAELVGRARPDLGDRARARSSTSPPRRSAATCPPLERPQPAAPGARRRRPADALTMIEAGLPDRDQRQHRAEGADRRAAALDLLPDGGCTRAARRRAAPPSGWPALLPPDLRADGGHPRGPDRRPAGPLPHVELHLLPGRVRGHHPGGRRRRDRRGARRAPRRRRLRRHQRHLRRPRPLHPRPRRRPPTKRAMVAARPARGRARRREQDRRRSARCGSPTLDDVDVAGHRRRHRPGRRQGVRGRRRCDVVEVVTGMIVTLTAQPEHRPHGRPAPAPLERGAVHRVESVTSQAGGKGVNISRAAVAAGLRHGRGAARRARTTRSSTSCGAAGIDCQPRAARRRRPRQPHPHRARRHHHQAQQPRRHRSTPPRSTRWPPRSSPHADDGRLGGARRLAAAGCTRRLVRRPGRARCASTPAASRVDTSEAPLVRRWSPASPTPRPTCMKPNAEELASLTGDDAAGLEADPEAAARPPRTLVDRGVGAVLATLGGHGAVLVTADGAWHAHRAPDHRRQHRRRRRLQPVRLPARRCRGGAPRPTGWGSRRRLRQPPSAPAARPIPTPPRRPIPDLVRVRPSTLQWQAQEPHRPR